MITAELKTKIMITLNITIGGNLCIELDKGAKEELKELIENSRDERSLLTTLLDDSGYIGNDWYSLYDVGLTEAPIIAYGAIHNDELSEYPDDYEQMWIFNDYMLRSFAEELLKNKKVIFKKV